MTDPDHIEALVKRIEDGAQSCPPSTAAGVEPDVSASSAGSQSQQSAPPQSSKGLLIVKATHDKLEADTARMIRMSLEPLAQRLGCDVLVTDRDAEAALTYDPAAVVQAIDRQTAALTRHAEAAMGLVTAVGQLAGMVSDLLDRVPLPEDADPAQAMGSVRKGRVGGRG